MSTALCSDRIRTLGHTKLRCFHNGEAARPGDFPFREEVYILQLTCMHLNTCIETFFTEYKLKTRTVTSVGVGSFTGPVDLYLELNNNLDSNGDTRSRTCVVRRLCQGIQQLMCD